MILILILQKRVFLFILNNREVIKRKLEAVNIAPLRDSIASFATLLDSTQSQNIKKFNINLDDTIQISVDSSYINTNKQNNTLLDSTKDLLMALKPWRKGPFDILGNHIESEWNSSIKFNLIKNHLNIEGKVVADIGCNNGYYMFRLLPLKPTLIVGFEPSAFCKCQFDFINSFIKSDIIFELLGLEDLRYYDIKFDTILCLGVLYHRTNPIESLKILKQTLNNNGEIIIDSIVIDSKEPLVLSPLTYAKMKNVYFIPSISALSNWLKRAGFKNIEILAIKKTDINEQRKTKWINGESLEDFLCENDSTKTIEGYPAPIRAYIKAK